MDSAEKDLRDLGCGCGWLLAGHPPYQPGKNGDVAGKAGGAALARALGNGWVAWSMAPWLICLLAHRQASTGCC